MSVLKISLLGPPAIELDGATIKFDTRKILAMLAYLGVTGETHTRDSLITLL
jgi:DNA-binding SARP family transcriptional activator